jgi:hypothetical protein
MEKLHRLEQVSCDDLQEALGLAVRAMGTYGALFDKHGEIAAVANVLVIVEWCADHGVTRQRLIATIDEVYRSRRRLRLANP